MSKYLSCTPVNVKDTPYANYGINEWALEFIEQYGGFDGAHHKMWVLDQVARILNGTEVEIELVLWEGDRTTFNFWTAEQPSEKYLLWVLSMLGEQDEDGDFEYSWDTGIAP